MYESFDEEVFLAPESVVAGIVATAALDDDFGMIDDDPLGLPRPGVAKPHVDETASIEPDALQLDAWARHAGAANGFGD